MARATNAQSKQNRMPSRSIFQNAPASVMRPRLWVIFSAAALLTIGLVMVFSASSVTGYVEQGSSTGEALRQIVCAAIGIALCVVCTVLGREHYLRGGLGIGYWILCMLLIILTATMGTVGLGAKRWLYIGSVGIQPSEFAKIAFVIMTTQIICERNEGSLDGRGFMQKLFIFVLIPLVIIFIAQSDLGTTVICAVAFLVALWLGGVDIRIFVGLLAVMIILGLLAIVFQGYRADRLIFLNPWADPANTGYQLIHSFKALAAGGLTGVGLGNSYEKLLYLPEAETDFIFSIVGEELGLVGTVVVVALFMAFFYGGLSVARRASTDYGLILAGTLTTMLVFQAMLNMLCVVGLSPTTGKPLPFISSGGSSLISSLMIVGLILAVSFDSDDKRRAQEKRDNLRVVTSYTASQRQKGRGATQMRMQAHTQQTASFGYRGYFSHPQSHTRRM